MTEDEAKTKWCPFVRFVSSTIGEHDAFANRPFEPEVPVHRCIASACMAWRTVADSGKWVSETHSPEELAIAQTLEDVSAVYVREGFCGLAGPPQ